MAKELEDSLGGEGTFNGGGGDVDAKSLGDQATLGGESSDNEFYDDGLEVVDLEARYKIEGTLGKGGMGEVLLAKDTRLDRKVAIKRIRGPGERSKSAVSRFLTEAQSIAALNHANIVQIYDYGRAKDGPFLIMEYVDGGSLLDRCRDGALPLEEVIDLTCQLCDGLVKAHNAGIIHRDIKPANVLLTKDGVPKLTDFGLAKAEAADTGMTMAGAILGTLDFMPPEQRKDAASVDIRSDLWSLAATLYQMVTGESPRVIDLDNVPLQLRATLSRALKSKKEDRYQTAKDFKAALRGNPVASEVSAPAAGSMELGEGICSSCCTQNDLQRKFCKKCAEPLRVSCLRCKQEIPIWDEVCGECGAKQADIVEQLRSEVESLIQKLQFDRAILLANEILAGKDVRWQHQRGWAESLISEATAEKDRQTQNAAKLFNEARKHREAFDYSSAIHALESIAEPLRTPLMTDFLAAVTKDRDELNQLVRLIGGRVKARDLDGLLEMVEAAIVLDGNRKDLQKLRQQLFDRETKITEAFSLAESLLSEGKAKAALGEIEKVPANRMTLSHSQFKDRLQVMVTAETKLSRQLAAAKKDGFVDPQEVIALLCSTIRCLELNPQQAAVQRLQSDLLERLQAYEDHSLNIRVSENESKTLAALPYTVLAKLPVEVISKLPMGVIAKLPAATILRLSTELSRQLAAARKDSFVDPQEVIALLCSTTRCLELNPQQAAVQRLQSDLLERLQAVGNTWLNIRVSEDDSKTLAALPDSVLDEIPDKVIAKLPMEVIANLPDATRIRLEDASSREARRNAALATVAKGNPGTWEKTCPKCGRNSYGLYANGKCPYC